MIVILITIVSHHSKVLFYLIGWLASPLLLLPAILLIGLNDDDYSGDNNDYHDGDVADVRQEHCWTLVDRVV